MDVYFCPAVVKLKSETTDISQSHTANGEKLEMLCTAKLNLRTRTSQRYGQQQARY